MSRPQQIVCFLSLIFVLLVSCSKRVELNIPPVFELDPVLLEDEHPRRAASLRLVGEGNRELSASKFERAAAIFTQAIEIDAGNPYAHFFLGQARMKSGRKIEAAEHFKRAAHKFRDLRDWRAESLAYAGQAMFELGSMDKAERLYSEALAVDRYNARAYHGRQEIENSTPE